MKQEKEVVIHIDNKPYKTSSQALTGAEIRLLPESAVGSDRDLFLVVPGPQDDKKIVNDESVAIENGMHFYSAPTNINPGK